MSNLRILEMNEIRNAITSLLDGPAPRAEKAHALADLIRKLRNYRWVGVYDVGPELASIIAYSGSGAPAYLKFPVTKGLTGAATREKRTVVVGDVLADSRYLTAFGTTRSEIIVPVLDEKTGAVIGTIDVESEQPNAFSDDDQRMLEDCARAARPLWTLN